MLLFLMAGVVLVLMRFGLLSSVGGLSSWSCPASMAEYVVGVHRKTGSDRVLKKTTLVYKIEDLVRSD
jgi:hypothetical protein